MKRRYIGFLTGSGVSLVVDLTVIVTLGITSTTASTVWWFFNFPTLPLMYCCVSLSQPPMGEAEITGWDYMMLIAMIFWSVLIWGGLGWLIGMKTEGKVK